MERLRFYISHSFNDLWVGGQRTLFALLCIAAGVAAVVSLQTLGAMISNVLTTNLQEINRGDLNITPPRFSRPTNGPAEIGLEEGHLISVGGGTTVFTEAGIQAIETRIYELDPNAVITYRHFFVDSTATAQGLSLFDESDTPVGVLILGIPIEAQHYPLYGEIRTLDGKTLAEVIRTPTDIVISENAAIDNDIEVGEQVGLFGTVNSNQRFTVRGIVETEAETLSENAGAAITTGFYYLDVSAVPFFEDRDRSRYAFEIYVKLSDPDFENVQAISDRLEAEFLYTNARTTTDLRERQRTIADAVYQLVLIMGLVSLLIGGIGIVNTMVVIVARRTVEIAVLKTIGLQARQVTVLFLVEAVVLGFVGSLIGVVLGLGAARILQQVTENIIEQRLDWVLDPAAIIRGMMLGVLITTVFGFLPTLIAGQVRPGNVLRPSERSVPRAGIFNTVTALLVTFIVLGGITWTIMGDDISPDPEGPFNIVGLVAVCALTAGIGGAAIMPGLPFFQKKPSELNRRGKRLFWLVLAAGLLLQTGLQSVLFYATGTVLEVALTGRLTSAGQIIAVVCAGLIGLWVSMRTLRSQPSVPLTFGAVILGFIAGVLAGAPVGIAVGLPLATFLPNLAPNAWKLMVDYFVNIAAVETAFIGIGMLVGVLWLLVALASHLPSFGVPDVKISLRSLSNNRNRVSSTVLALVIGVLALSTVTMLTSSLRRFFEISIVENVGGNVFMLVNPGADGWTASERRLETFLAGESDVKSYSIITSYVGDFVALRKKDGSLQDRADLIAIMQRDARVRGDEAEFTSFLDFTLGQVGGRSVSSALPDYEFEPGNRQLTPEDTCAFQLQTRDTCELRVVVTGNLAVQAANIEAGDTIIMKYAIGEERIPVRLEFKIVGVSTVGPDDIRADNINPIYAPLDAFQYQEEGERTYIPPQLMGAVVDVEEARIGAFKQNVAREMAGTFVIETKLLNRLLNEVIDRFVLLPSLVAALALVTGGIVIANSVALSTMERRREIAIMKAIGLQRERVLGMLLFENSLMGFLGGLIGVGAAVIALIQLWALLFAGEDLRDAVPLSDALILMVICIGLSLLAAIVTAWRASGEKPLNVLRYE